MVESQEQLLVFDGQSTVTSNTLGLRPAPNMFAATGFTDREDPEDSANPRKRQRCPEAEMSPVY